MNAVEAVEQLGALGRKLQAREVGLQQPSLRLQAVLRQSVDWEKVLGDPVAALSQLLGTAGGGQARAKDSESAPEAPVSALPLAAFRWEEDLPPVGSGISTGRSGFGSGQSGDTGSGSGSSSGLAGGMRLARRQTSLLGILNANLEDRVYGRMGVQGSAAVLTGEASPEKRPAARDEDAADLSEPVARWSAAPSSVAPQDEMRQPSGQAAQSFGGSQQDKPGYRDGSAASLTDAASLTGQGIVSDRQGGEPGAAAGAGDANVPGEGDVAAGMGVWAYESLPQHGQAGAARLDGRLNPGEHREPARDKVSGPHTDIPAAQPGLPQSQARSEGQVGDWNGWLQNADVAPVQDGVWAQADERQEERPLSMAQIEQVLSALDERLELMLLRMYGSAGGLP